MKHWLYLHCLQFGKRQTELLWTWTYVEPHRAGPATENINCQAPNSTFHIVHKMLDSNTNQLFELSSASSHNLSLFLVKAILYICSAVATNIVKLCKAVMWGLMFCNAVLNIDVRSWIYFWTSLRRVSKHDVHGVFLSEFSQTVRASASSFNCQYLRFFLKVIQ